jgi:hypothetical protein
MSGIAEDEVMTVWQDLARRLLDHRGYMDALRQ